MAFSQRSISISSANAVLKGIAVIKKVVDGTDFAYEATLNNGGTLVYSTNVDLVIAVIDLGLTREIEDEE